MVREGYKRFEYDNCVYYKLLKGNLFIYLLIYVDDILIACKDKREIMKLTKSLSLEFEMKNLGATKRILGIDIERNRKEETLTLSQTGYVRKVVELFEMSSCKSVTTPIPSHFKLCDVKKDLSKDDALLKCSR